MLKKEPRIEQELRKYQVQENDHGLEYGSRTIVLKPLKDNQGFRIQGPRSSGNIMIKTY